MIYRWCKIDEWRISRGRFHDYHCSPDPFPWNLTSGVGKRASGQAWRGGPSSFSYLGYWVVGSSASLSLPHLVDAHSKLRDASATTRCRDTILAYAIRKTRGKLLLRDEQYSREQWEITRQKYTIRYNPRLGRDWQWERAIGAFTSRVGFLKDPHTISLRWLPHDEGVKTGARMSTI